MSEPTYPYQPGFLQVYYGPMSGGKTLKIIQKLRKAEHIGGVESIIFQPRGRTRTPGRIETRLEQDGTKLYMPAFDIPYDDPWKAEAMIEDRHKIVVFDEVPFFSPDICGLIFKLLKKNIDVAVSGLNLDFRGEPFLVTNYLLAHSIYPIPCMPVCTYKTKNGGGVEVNCGKLAERTQRKFNGVYSSFTEDIIMIETNLPPGTVVEYYPVCVAHHIVPGSPVNKPYS